MNYFYICRQPSETVYTPPDEKNYDEKNTPTTCGHPKLGGRLHLQAAEGGGNDHPVLPGPAGRIPRLRARVVRRDLGDVQQPELRPERAGGIRGGSTQDPAHLARRAEARRMDDAPPLQGAESGRRPGAL